MLFFDIIDIIGEFLLAFFLIIISAIVVMICAAGIIITATCIYKVTEKIVKIIENFFDNL